MSPDSNVYAAPNVLVVNDARDTLELIVFSLEREGYRVLTAANGREALEIAGAATLDVIISDVVMPEMDGVELCRRLRENSSTAQIPILLFSAERTSETDSLEGLRAGADDYLEIPFRQPELLVKVARLIERRRLKRYYRQIVELSPNIIYTLDAARRLVGINDAGLKFFGRTPAQLRGQPESDLLAPHVLSANANSEREPFADDSTVVLDVKNAAGEKRTIELRRKSFHDDIGNLTGFHCIIQDSTERFAFERALRDSEQRYRTLYEDSPLMYFVLDENGLVKSLNRTAIEKLGYAEDELIGKQVLDVFLREDRPRVAEQIELLKRSASGVAQWEFCKVHKNGDIVRVSENVRMLPQATGGSIFLVICEDITERVAAEQKTAELIAELNATVEREELINRITAHVRESLQLEIVFEAAVNELGARLGADRSTLYILNEKTRNAEPRAVYIKPDLANPPPAAASIPLAQIAAMLEKFGDSGFVVIEEINFENTTFDVYENVLKPRRVRSLMCAAIYIDEKLIGFIGFSMHEKSRLWSEPETALARAVAANIGIAIRQAQLFARAEAASKREALINRLSTAIRGSLQLSEVHRTATHELGKALDASRVYLRLYDSARLDEDAAAEFVYTSANFAGEPIPAAKYTEPIGAAILQNSQPIIINDTAEGAHESDLVNDFALARLNSRGVLSAVYCPILVDEKYRGTLCIEQNDRQRDWTETDAALIESVAAQLALGVSQAELFELARRARRDWETTFDAMGDGVFIFDRTGKLIRVNRAGAWMEQSTVQNLIGKN